MVSTFILQVNGLADVTLAPELPRPAAVVVLVEVVAESAFP